MVVMAVRLEDALDLVDADAERIEDGLQIGSGVDQVKPAFVHQDARHARPFRVPAVALACVQYGEVLPLDVVEIEPVG